MKILLVGNPNVGKSSLFSRLTGTQVICSNYPGTTVGYCSGTVTCAKQKNDIIDVPGIYSLKPQSPADKVAVDMMREGETIINVVDATNLERNLYLTLEVLECGKPTIVALNMIDDARHRGIEINVSELEKMLGVPVVKTVAVTAEGVKDLVEKISTAKKIDIKRTEEERWKEVGRIINAVQKIKDKKHSLTELLEDATIRPLTGIPIALLILFLTFQLIITAGNYAIENILDPFFYQIYDPVIRGIIEPIFAPKTLLHELLIGSSEDYAESRGLLTTGIYVPIGMILPFVVLFYTILAILEDTGYLPRLATLMDNLMHRIGLHGTAIVPAILGMGCRVPGILATRILETEKQRFISATLIAISVPCLAQMAVILGLLLPHGIQYVAIVYIALLIIHMGLGLILNKYVKGESPEILLEIPPYRMPKFDLLTKKIWYRVKYFLIEAIPYLLIGVVVINMLYLTGVVDATAKTFGPILETLFGLPEEAIIAIIVGFLRKDAAVGMLAPIQMTAMQLTIASILLITYFPCIATLTILYKELGAKNFLKTIGLMLIITLITGITLKALLL